MSFTNEERNYISTYFSEDSYVTANNIDKIVAPEIYKFLLEKNRISTVVDNIFFINKNDFRPYDSCVITKCLTSDLNISKTIEDISACINGKYLMFIDAHFIILCPSASEDKDLIFKFQQGSKASSFNDTIKIFRSKDYNDFLFEFKNLSPSTLLNNVFEHHKHFCDYHGSGLRPYALISLLLNIQKVGYY